jgi:hypothetical protein
VNRPKDLRIPVSPIERRRICSRAATLGYASFAAYGRAVLSDPFGPFTKNRLADILRDLHDVERAILEGDQSATDRLRSLQQRIGTWID